MGKKNKEKNIHNIFAAYFTLFSVCHALESRHNIQQFHSSRLSHDSPSVLHQVQNVTYYLQRK